MNKVCNLREAIERDVQDGTTIAMGCALESLIPFAASHEIIRQNKKNLTLVAPISDMQFDQLIGAGSVKKIIASWVGNVAAGLGHNYRRAAEAGIPHPIEIEEHSNFTIGLGLQAGAMGVPFLPTRTIKGSDFARHEQHKRIHCPFSDEELLAVRAIQPPPSRLERILVMDGGCTRSMEATSPALIGPCLRTDDSADNCDSVSSVCTRCNRSRRAARSRLSRSAEASSELLVRVVVCAIWLV